MIQTIKAFMPLAKHKAQVSVKKMTAKLRGDSQIVVALVLIAVAIGLCIIFRNEIFRIMNNLFTTIGGQINNLTAGKLDTIGEAE